MTTRKLLLLQSLAFWPVWWWYVGRMTDGSDEPWGCAALLLGVVLFLRDEEPVPCTGASLFQAFLLGTAYAIAVVTLPPLVRALLAVTALGMTMLAGMRGKCLNVGLLGLLILSLPLIASLQFYMGFPVRLITAHLVSSCLTVFGFPVEAVGTLLKWRGDFIAVDAPCSGVKTLWVLLTAAFGLAAYHRFGPFETWRCYVAALVIAFIGNFVRVTVLFFTESRIIEAPEFFHTLIGIAILCGTSTILFLFVERLECRVSRA